MITLSGIEGIPGFPFQLVGSNVDHGNPVQQKQFVKTAVREPRNLGRFPQRQLAGLEKLRRKKYLGIGLGYVRRIRNFKAKPHP